MPETPDTTAVDLSIAANRERAAARKLAEAASWARQMSRTFKGVRGGQTRRGYVMIAIDRFALNEDNDG